MYVSTVFVNSTILKLEDAASSGTEGNYSNISTSGGSPTSLTPTGVASGSSLTRYLGLFVKKVVTGFSGADSATLTYTLTVQ